MQIPTRGFDLTRRNILSKHGGNSFSRISLPTLFFVFDERKREKEKEREKEREREREGEGGFTDECFSDIGNIRTALRRVGFRSPVINHRWLLFAIFFLFFFSLPSTAMPREPYAKIRERKRGRKGKGKGTFVIARIVPLPGSAGYSNALNRQATREIGSDSGKHRDTRSLGESKNMPISSFFSSFFFFFFEMARGKKDGEG